MEAEDAGKFAELTSMTFKQQGGEEQAETVWGYVQIFEKLCEKKGEGSDLDEFLSHKFLEELGETLTVIALREKLKAIDVDLNRRMCLLEYLIYKYEKTVKEVCGLTQGSNMHEMEKAQAMVDEAQAAVDVVTAKLEAQRKVEEPFIIAEKAATDAEAENKAALDALHKEEEEYNGKIKSLETQIATLEGVVKKNRAIAQLEQLKAEDPMPLRKAKITQAATVRKAEKARKAAEVARAPIAAATAAVEKAVAEAEGKFKEAIAYLEEIKAKGGVAYGSIWWMEREMQEKMKFMPKKKAAAMAAQSAGKLPKA